MSLAILFHFLYTRHVSDINIAIIKNLRLCCWITTSVGLFCKVGGFSVSVNLWCLSISPWRLLSMICRMDVQSLGHVAAYLKCLLYSCSFILALDIHPANHSNLQGVMDKHHTFMLTLNPPSLQNKTSDVVMQQHCRKLLMMDILMPEICWVYKKWNKTASDIKLVFYSSTITMMHGPINITVCVTHAVQEFDTCDEIYFITSIKLLHVSG